jgi:hypothetical protein
METRRVKPRARLVAWPARASRPCRESTSQRQKAQVRDR